jgi:hypothetical protein
MLCKRAQRFESLDVDSHSPTKLYGYSSLVRQLYCDLCQHNPDPLGHIVDDDDLTFCFAPWSNELQHPMDLLWTCYSLFPVSLSVWTLSSTDSPITDCDSTANCPGDNNDCYGQSWVHLLSAAASATSLITVEALVWSAAMSLCTYTFTWSLHCDRTTAHCHRKCHSYLPRGHYQALT